MRRSHGAFQDDRGGQQTRPDVGSIKHAHCRLQHEIEDEGEHDRQDDLRRNIATRKHCHQESAAAEKHRFDIRWNGRLVFVGSLNGDWHSGRRANVYSLREGSIWLSLAIPRGPEPRGTVFDRNGARRRQSIECSPLPSFFPALLRLLCRPRHSRRRTAFLVHVEESAEHLPPSRQARSDGADWDS